VGGPTILHVDMDAFYAAVEVRDDPSLAGRPLVVGGTGRRGVVASCSYEARAYGIRSAMPAARARALCPSAVFVPGRFDRYREASAAIHAVFEEVTPLVEGIALDEAFLDVAGAERLFGPPAVIAASLRARVAETTGLTCSVGAAAVKFLAKLASEAAKPTAALSGPVPGRGVVVVEPGQELAFLHPLPIEALWGVGPAAAARLRRLGLTTVGELAQVSPAVLEQAVGRTHGAHLHRLAHAVDGRSVVVKRPAKSVGHEETYATDRHDQESCRREVLRMADAVAARLRAAGTAGRTVTLKVRYGDFTTITRSRTVPTPVDTARQVASLAGGLLATVDVGPGVRLLGVSVSQLGAPPAPEEQLLLALDGAASAGVAARGPGAPPPSDGAAQPGDGTDRAWAAAAEAVERVRGRFGASSVGPAALLGSEGLRVKRQGDTQWGPSQSEERR
jgi:DNA polymerase-4